VPKIIDNDRSLNDYSITPKQLIDQIKIPYKTLYAFGENLPAIERGTRDPNDLGFVYETISAVLANDLQQVDSLVDSRDTFIKKAKGDLPLIASDANRESVDLSERLKLIDEKKRLEQELFRAKASSLSVKKSGFIITGVITVFLTIVIYYLYKRSSVAEQAATTLDSIIVQQTQLRDLEDSLNEIKNDSIATMRKYEAPPLASNETFLNDTSTAYVYCGLFYDGKWIEQNFISDITGELPVIGESLTAKVNINVRSGIIQYVDAQWKNKPIVGLLNPGDRILVREVYRVAGGAFIWVKFSPVKRSAKKESNYRQRQ
jgi:hypothetical protein